MRKLAKAQSTHIIYTINVINTGCSISQLIVFTKNK